MEGYIAALDERIEVCRNMPSEPLKPGKLGSWGYPRSAFCDSPASVDRKSESSNSVEAVDKDYGERWEHAGEVSPPQNSNCSDKMSVGFRPGEMSPAFDMYSDGGRLSVAEAITPRDGFEKCLNCRPGEPFLEADISNVHSSSYGTPIKEEPPSFSPNYSPREGHIRYQHKIRRSNLMDNSSSPKMLINPNVSALNHMVRAKKPSTHQLIFNRIERAKWNVPKRLVSGSTSKTNTSKKIEELLSSWEVFLHQLKDYEQTPTDFVKAIEAHLQLTKKEVGIHANETVVAPKEGSNIVQDKFYNRKPNYLTRVIEPRREKTDSCFLNSRQLTRSDPKAEYCSDEEIGLWPEDKSESVIPFQAPSTENSDLPVFAVLSGDSSEMKLNDSEEVNFTNAVNIYDNESKMNSLVIQNSFSADAISCSTDHSRSESVSNLGEPTSYTYLERNNSDVKLAVEERSQNVNDVNKAWTFSKQADPREVLAFPSRDNRESTIAEAKESLTAVFTSPVKNLSPVESCDHEQVNTGYSLCADPTYSGKHVFSQRANESGGHNNGNKDIGNSQAGMSSCNESPMLINPNRNEYYTPEIKANALPKHLPSKKQAYKTVAVPCEVTSEQSARCLSKAKSQKNYTSRKSKYSANRERPVREAHLAADSNLPITDASLISDTLKFNQNPPPFNRDFVRSHDVEEAGHYKRPSGYKYQPKYEHPSAYEAHGPRCYQPYFCPSQDRNPYDIYKRRSFETYQSYLPSVYENRGCHRISLPYPEPHQQYFHPLYPSPYLI